LIPPTYSVQKTGERLVIDGVEIVFQMTPGTEAPVEMNFYFPGLRALNMAENACHTMHNLCPLRGAKVRDARAWALYLNESVDLFAGKVDVCLAQHHWPTWGNERVIGFLCEQRDLYQYLHDQTLRMMSHGLTPREISEKLMMPNELARRWHARGYYGAVVHNVQAIYAFYMGPYDGNPVNLNPLPPAEAGAKYMAYSGGLDAAIARARADFDRGEFRWVAQIANHAVFADPTHTAARSLCAEALEQLGYQSESATWRNAYLLAARELREGGAGTRSGKVIDPQMVAQLPIPLFFDYLGMQVLPQAGAEAALRFDWVMEDETSSFKVTVSNGALTHRPGSHGTQADAVVRTTRAKLLSAMRSDAGFPAAIDKGDLKVEGNSERVRAFLQRLDTFNHRFNVAEP
jgi:alkyl sulfatase BDS1-like metallo-beta-lactamase superfamily hydrolase